MKSQIIAVFRPIWAAESRKSEQTSREGDTGSAESDLDKPPEWSASFRRSSPQHVRPARAEWGKPPSWADRVLGSAACDPHFSHGCVWWYFVKSCNLLNKYRDVRRQCDWTHRDGSQLCEKDIRSFWDTGKRWTSWLVYIFVRNCNICVVQRTGPLGIRIWFEVVLFFSFVLIVSKWVWNPLRFVFVPMFVDLFLQGVGLKAPPPPKWRQSRLRKTTRNYGRKKLPVPLQIPPISLPIFATPRPTLVSLLDPLAENSSFLQTITPCGITNQHNTAPPPPEKKPHAGCCSFRAAHPPIPTCHRFDCVWPRMTWWHHQLSLVLTVTRAAKVAKFITGHEGVKRCLLLQI